MTMKTAHGEHHHGLMTPQAPGPTYPFVKGALVIGAVLGDQAGLAYANSYTRDLVPLMEWSIIYCVVGMAILGVPAWIIDVVRHRRGRSMS
jgi:hypothetical protein